jgi:hypothetical protein
VLRTILQILVVISFSGHVCLGESFEDFKRDKFRSESSVRAPVQFLNHLTEQLRTTTDKNAAAVLSRQIRDLLNEGKGVGGTMKATPTNSHHMSREEAIIAYRSRLAIERFSNLNIEGDNAASDPRYIEDEFVKLGYIYNPSYADNETYRDHRLHLIHLAIISIASQEYLWNPKSTILDLRNKVKRVFNQNNIPEWAKMELKKIPIENIITDSFIHALSASELPVESSMKDILKRRQGTTAMTYMTEPRDKASPTEVSQTLDFVHYGSSGKGMQCGFFSSFLIDDGGNNTARHKFYQTYTDHLDDPLIYLRSIGLIESDMPELLARVSSERSKESYKNEFLTLCTPKLKQLDEEFEKKKKELGLPSVFPQTPDKGVARSIEDDDIIARGSVLRDGWFLPQQLKIESEAWKELIDRMSADQKTRFHGILKNHLIGKIHQLLQHHSHSAELTIGPSFFIQHIHNPTDAWDLTAALAHIYNYNIYAWVSKGLFDYQYNWITNPIRRSTDGNYVLINLIYNSDSAKDVHLINISGGHYEKFTEKDDCPAIARSIRRNGG